MVFLAQDELFNLLPENEGFCELKKKPFSPLAGTGFDVVSGTLPIMPSVTALEQYGLCSGTPGGAKNNVSRFSIYLPFFIGPSPLSAI